MLNDGPPLPPTKTTSTDLLPYDRNSVHKLIRTLGYWKKAGNKPVGKYALHVDKEAKLPAACSGPNDLSNCKSMLKYCSIHSIKIKRSDKALSLTKWAKKYLPKDMTYTKAHRSVSLSDKDKAPENVLID